METRTQSVYRLGDLLIETGSQRILRAGKPLDLPRLSRKLLIALVESSPAPLTEAQIAAAVWGGRYVSPGTITQRVCLLRRALGDDASEPRYIALERGVGYRLVTGDTVVDPARELQSPALRETASGKAVASTVAAAATACLLLVTAAVTTRSPPEPDTAAVPLVAQEHFKRGEIYYHRRGEGDLQRAEESYQLAIALAPEYADPWVSLAAVYNLQAWTDGQLSMEESLLRQQRALEHAVRLQPDLAIAYARLARLIYMAGGDPEQARAHLERALALAPDEPMVLAIYAGDLGLRGEHQAALAMLRKAVHVQPSSLLHRLNLMASYMRHGYLAEAETQLETLISLHPDQYEQFSLDIAHLHLLREQPERALKNVSDSLRPEDKLFIRAVAHHQMGSAATSESLLGQLDELGTPYAMARHGEALYYLEGGAHVDKTLRRLLDIRAGQPGLWAAATHAGIELIHSPFIELPAAEVHRMRMHAVYAVNER